MAIYIVMPVVILPCAFFMCLIPLLINNRTERQQARQQAQPAKKSPPAK
jgi:hypothetical protein